MPGVELDDIGCTSKTMPEFATLWATMIDDADAGPGAGRDTATGAAR